MNGILGQLNIIKKGASFSKLDKPARRPAHLFQVRSVRSFPKNTNTTIFVRGVLVDQGAMSWIFLWFCCSLLQSKHKSSLPWTRVNSTSYWIRTFSFLPTAFSYFFGFTLGIIVVKAGLKINHQNVLTVAFVQTTDVCSCLAICKRILWSDKLLWNMMSLELKNSFLWMHNLSVACAARASQFWFTKYSHRRVSFTCRSKLW